jgi:hypothetical protein
MGTGTVSVAWYPAGKEKVGAYQDGLVPSWCKGGKSRWVLSEWVGTGTQLLRRR